MLDMTVVPLHNVITWSDIGVVFLWIVAIVIGGGFSAIVSYTLFCKRGGNDRAHNN